MSKEINEEMVKDIIKEDHYEDGYEQKVIFDQKTFNQIQKEDLDLSVNSVFKNPTIKDRLKINKEEYYVVSKREHIIDCKYAKGTAKIPLISKICIEEEIDKIKPKNQLKYVYLAATELLLQACFREGIDTPIEIAIMDDRIKYPIEKSIITSFKGNLVYQKLKFTVSPNYTIALTDKNIEKSIVLYWNIMGIELTPGSKIMTARCKNLYVLTNKHIVSRENKIRKIKINNPFDKIITLTDEPTIDYEEINNKESSIVSQRISQARIEDLSKPISYISYKGETSQPKNNISQYHINGLIDNKIYPILIDTAAGESYISPELIKYEEIKPSEFIYADLNGNIFSSKGRITKEIVISGMGILVDFEIQEEKQNHKIILGTKWLENVKPYDITDSEFIFTYNKKRIITKRLLKEIVAI